MAYKASLTPPLTSVIRYILYRSLQFIKECQRISKGNKKLTLENIEGESNINNPEKLATQGTQDEEKQNKNTTQSVMATTTRN